jgi:hypothetical protein
MWCGAAVSAAVGWARGRSTRETRSALSPNRRDPKGTFTLIYRVKAPYL